MDRLMEAIERGMYAIVLFFIVFVCGVVAGYSWRMHQEVTPLSVAYDRSALANAAQQKQYERLVRERGIRADVVVYGAGLDSSAEASE